MPLEWLYDALSGPSVASSSLAIIVVSTLLLDAKVPDAGAGCVRRGMLCWAACRMCL